MKVQILVNALYTAVTWACVFALGLTGVWAWLAWATLAMAVLQTYALVSVVIKTRSRRGFGW